MTAPDLEIPEFASLALGLVLLVFGIALLVHLRRKGGLELSLAKMISDARHRGVFLLGLIVSLVALFSLGLGGGLAALLGASGATEIELQSALFGVGSVGMLVLMVNALRTPPPSLEDGWHLQETAERMTNAAIPLARGFDRGPDPSTDDRSSAPRR